MNSIQTEPFRLSRSEYLWVVRRILLKRRALPLLLAWAATLTLFTISTNTLSVTAFNQWLPLVIGLTFWSFWALVLAPMGVVNGKAAQMLYQQHHYQFSDESIIVTFEDGTRAERPMKSIITADRLGEFILLWQDTGFYYIVPASSFSNSTLANNLLARFTNSTASTAPPNQLVETAPGGIFIQLHRNISTASRLLFFRKTRLEEFAVTADQLLLLMLTTAAFAIGVDYFDAGDNPEFSLWGVMDQATGFLLLLIGSYLVARKLQQPTLFMPLALILFSLEPLLILIIALIDATSTTAHSYYTTIPYLILTIWILLIWRRAILITFQPTRLQATATTGLLYASAFLPLLVMPSAQYWYPSYNPDDSDKKEQVNTEEVYYRQPELLLGALEGMLQERAGITDLYHIGFGGYANQDVFRQEISHVRSILEQRFDTRDRSLSLINNPSTVEKLPIASISNLERALYELPAIMNPEEDILFLYLTSHGSKNATLSVNFSPLNLNQLTAIGLREMLDRTGIKWRVIVISACYSGSFTDVLKQDNSLIITAAAADKTSFGCSNKNEYTYFGEAYFQQALTKTFSFVEAFEIASKMVTMREKNEGMEPSSPTLFVGNSIRKHLLTLEQRLQAEL